ncbi:AMP-binding protein [Microlunatus flavus]|uniref:AMP-binding enzyme n=1 Tax=Microlunatus flavus TaxID=1036181 RepID=A0A1H8ZIF3_9ACTN|nr:AMP-binding protein [Microlunatus flavus]SEP64063.1 AMP-binding enzyme [Microlunatus flavus]
MTPTDPPAETPQVAPDWFARPSGSTPGSLNLAYNALDRHVVRGLADEPALLHPFAAAGVRSYYSYAELLERVAQLGGGLRELGVRPGRQVVLALGPVPELVIGLLACARVGAVAVPVMEEAPGAVRRLGHDPAVDRPAVVVVDAARKAAVAAVLAEAGRSADYQVVLRPEAGTLDASLGDIDLAAVMKPGSFEPAAAEVLPADSPLLLRLTDDGPAATYDHAWTLDLVAQALGAGWAPGTYVHPADDPTDATPYGALLGPLLVGAAVELR